MKLLFHFRYTSTTFVLHHKSLTFTPPSTPSSLHPESRFILPHPSTCSFPGSHYLHKTPYPLLWSLSPPTHVLLHCPTTSRPCKPGQHLTFVQSAPSRDVAGVVEEGVIVWRDTDGDDVGLEGDGLREPAKRE